MIAQREVTFEQRRAWFTSMWGTWLQVYPAAPALTIVIHDVRHEHDWHNYGESLSACPACNLKDHVRVRSRIEYHRSCQILDQAGLPDLSVPTLRSA